MVIKLSVHTNRWILTARGVGRRSACGMRWANIRSTEPGGDRRVFAWSVFEGALLAERWSVHAPGR